MPSPNSLPFHSIVTMRQCSLSPSPGDGKEVLVGRTYSKHMPHGKHTTRKACRYSITKLANLSISITPSWLKYVDYYRYLPTFFLRNPRNLVLLQLVRILPDRPEHTRTESRTGRQREFTTRRWRQNELSVEIIKARLQLLL